MRRMNGNEKAACLCIAGGVAAVLLASPFWADLAVGKLPQGGIVSSAEPSVSAPAPTSEPTPAPTPEPEPIYETVRFSASGDNLIHNGLFLQARDRRTDGGYDFAPAYEPMRSYFASCDVNWLNQETLVNNAYAPSGYPFFSTPGDITNALYDVGFRVFSTSNNHSYDQGAGGIAASREHWASLPDDVVTAGFYNATTYDDYAYHTVNGITIGYLSYTEHTNGLPTPEGSEYRVVYLDQTDVIEQQMAAMRPNCDVLVVSCHWGVEGSHTVTDGQRSMAQWLADHGADLIIGTHPHVTQTAEWLTAADGRTAFVAYSLGNFISAQAQHDNMIGLVLQIDFNKVTQPDGSVSVTLADPQLHPVVTHYGSGYSNIVVYPLQDYTDEMGAAHGNFTMSQASIRQVLEASVDPQFLTY